MDRLHQYVNINKSYVALCSFVAPDLRALTVKEE